MPSTKDNPSAPETDRANVRLYNAKGGGREASPFFNLDDGSVPSTGQRRPGLPRAGPAVLSARWGLASGFGTGPGVPPMLWPLTGGRRPPLRCPGSNINVPWGPHGA